MNPPPSRLLAAIAAKFTISVSTRHRKPWVTIVPLNAIFLMGAKN
jgi:hypothetical protein